MVSVRVILSTESGSAATAPDNRLLLFLSNIFQVSLCKSTSTIYFSLYNCGAAVEGDQWDGGLQILNYVKSVLNTLSIYEYMWKKWTLIKI